MVFSLLDECQSKQHVLKRISQEAKVHPGWVADAEIIVGYLIIDCFLRGFIDFMDWEPVSDKSIEPFEKRYGLVDSESNMQETNLEALLDWSHRDTYLKDLIDENSIYHALATEFDLQNEYRLLERCVSQIPSLRTEIHKILQGILVFNKYYEKTGEEVEHEIHYRLDKSQRRHPDSSDHRTHSGYHGLTDLLLGKTSISTSEVRKTLELLGKITSRYPLRHEAPEEKSSMLCVALTIEINRLGALDFHESRRQIFECWSLKNIFQTLQKESLRQNKTRNGSNPNHRRRLDFEYPLEDIEIETLNPADDSDLVDIFRQAYGRQTARMVEIMLANDCQIFVKDLATEMGYSISWVEKHQRKIRDNREKLPKKLKKLLEISYE